MKKAIYIFESIIIQLHFLLVELQALITFGAIELTHQDAMQDIYMFVWLMVGSIILYVTNFVIYITTSVKHPIKLKRYNLANLVLISTSVLLLML